MAVSGSLGIIIPPSIPYIMYCNASGASISELVLAGFLPGVLIALCLMVYSYIYCNLLIQFTKLDKTNGKYKRSNYRSRRICTRLYLDQ